MDIIVDTREQKPLNFDGHNVIKKKLSEGDYNVEELRHRIVIERKSLQDLYGSITKQHRRFRDEILRSRLQGKPVYIFIEGNLKEFYSLKWSKRRLNIRIPVLIKIIETMTSYDKPEHKIIIVECSSRQEMSDKIISAIEINKKLYGA